jgi:hypothetical protein
MFTYLFKDTTSRFQFVEIEELISLEAAIDQLGHQDPMQIDNTEITEVIILESTGANCYRTVQTLL